MSAWTIVLLCIIGVLVALLIFFALALSAIAKLSDEVIKSFWNR